MGIDFTTHPKGKFHAIDKTRHSIKNKLEQLMNSNKELFTIHTMNFCMRNCTGPFFGMIRVDQ